MIVRGNVFKYGDNVDTDVIIPARHLTTSDPAELAKYCMEDIDSDFAKDVRPGDIIVASRNFGCGSSREHAPIAIKGSGISCVIASSFARIFYRNAIITQNINLFSNFLTTQQSCLDFVHLTNPFTINTFGDIFLKFRIFQIFFF